MREYAKVSPCFWTGKTGIAIRRSGPEVITIALYLMTCPASNMIGVYSISKETISHDTGIPLEGALEGLQRVEELDFAAYDDEEEMVFVKKMARFQVGEKLSKNDNKCKGIYRALQQFRSSRFYNEFCEIYKDDYNLKTKAPYKPLQSPLQAPPKQRAGAGAGERTGNNTLPRQVEGDDFEDLKPLKESALEGGVGETPTPVPKPPPPRRPPRPKANPADVEAIYAAYPRHVGHAAAVKAIAKVIESGKSADWLLGRVKVYADKRAGEDEKFTPHPATWFNQGRYDDDDLVPQKPKKDFLRIDE